MNCEQARELLGPASDNELANESAAMVAGHISKCDQCQSEWEQILSVRAGIVDILAQQKPSDDFEKRIISALHQEQKNSRRKYLSAYLIGVAATIVLGSFAISAFLSSFRSPLSSTLSSIAAESLVASIGHHSTGPEDPSFVVNYVGKKDAVDLTPKVGFTVQRIKLTNYDLYGSDIVKTSDGKTLVRMCYNCTDGSSTDCIDCYQAPTGLLSLQKTTMSQIVLENGQVARLGKFGEQSALLLSKQGADILYVSPISSEKLIKLVAPTT
ncbi:zf-HC2 domain-containing protein [bacterium]|nr:zf-HC2 domain-containing protein [bacterium]MBP9811428.1 zf-HC2 domain-containing protein [bacterium]